MNKLMLFVGIVMCAFVSSNAQSPRVQNKGVIHVEQFFHGWTHCNINSKPKFNDCIITINGNPQEYKLTNDSMSCYIPIEAMHVTKDGIVNIGRELNTPLSLNVNLNAARIDDNNIKYDIEKIHRGINVSSEKEQSDRCFLWKDEGFSTYTKVTVDDPVVLTSTKDNSFLCIDDKDVCEIALNKFYVTDSTKCDVLVKLLSDTTDIWHEIKKHITPGEILRLKYEDIVYALPYDSAYYKCSGKQIEIKVTKLLIDGSISESNHLLCKFYHKGPIFKINTLRRTSCSDEVNLYVEASNNFELYNNNACKWAIVQSTDSILPDKITDKTGSYNIISFEKIAGNNLYKLNIENMFEKRVIDAEKQGGEYYWFFQFQQTDSDGMGKHFHTTRFEISSKIPNIQVKQQDKPEAQPYHIYNTSDPYVVLNIQDDDTTVQGRLPYIVMSKDKSDTLEIIRQIPVNTDETLKNLNDEFEKDLLKNKTKEYFLSSNAPIWYDIEGKKGLQSIFKTAKVENIINDKYFDNIVENGETAGTLIICESSMYNNKVIAITEESNFLANDEKTPLTVYNFKCRDYAHHDPVFGMEEDASGAIVVISADDFFISTNHKNITRFDLNFVWQNGHIILAYDDYHIYVLEDQAFKVIRTCVDDKILLNDLKKCDDAFLYANLDIVTRNGNVVTLYTKTSSYSWQKSRQVKLFKEPVSSQYVAFTDKYVAYKVDDNLTYKEYFEESYDQFKIEFVNECTMAPADIINAQWENYKAQLYYKYVLSKNGYQLHSKKLKINEADSLLLIDNDGCEYAFPYIVSANTNIRTTVTNQTKPSNASMSDGSVMIEIVPGGEQKVYYEGELIDEVKTLTIKDLPWGDTSIFFTDKDGSILKEVVISMVPNVAAVAAPQTCDDSNGEISVVGDDVSLFSEWECYPVFDETDKIRFSSGSHSHGFLKHGTYVVKGLFGKDRWISVDTVAVENKVFNVEVKNIDNATEIGECGQVTLQAHNVSDCINWSISPSVSENNGIYEFKLPKGNYEIEAADNNGCSVTKTFFIGGPDVQAEMFVCNTNNQTLHIDVSGKYENIQNPDLILKSDNGEIIQNGESLNLDFNYDPDKMYTVELSYDGAEKRYTLIKDVRPLKIVSETTDSSKPGRCFGEQGLINLKISDSESELGDATEISLNYDNWKKFRECSIPADSGMNVVAYRTLSEISGQRFKMTVMATLSDTVTISPGKKTEVYPEIADISCYGLEDGSISLTEEDRQNGNVWLRMGDKDFKDGIISNLPAGEVVYSVVTAECPNIVQLRETVIDAPTAPLTASVKDIVHPTCANDDGSVLVEIEGGWQQYIAIPETTDVESALDSAWQYASYDRIHAVTGLSAGYQQITVWDSNGCNVKADATLRQYVSPKILDTMPTPSTCNGYNDGTIEIESIDIDCSVEELQSLTLSINGTAMPYRQVVDRLSAGSYTMYVTDSNNCTGEPYTTEIEEPKPLLLEAKELNNGRIADKNAEEGRAEIVVRGGNDGYKTIVSEAQTLIVPTGVPTIIDKMSAGTFRMSAADTRGCVSNEVQLTFAEPEQELTLTAKSTDALCHAMTGTISAEAAGGWKGYSIRLAGVRETRYADEHEEVVFTGLYAGEYFLVVTDNEGVEKALTVKVGAPEPISHKLIVTPDACEGDGRATIELAGGTPGYASLFQNETDTLKGNKISLDNLRADKEYELFTSDANNCVSYITFMIPDERLSVAVKERHAGDGVVLHADVTGGAKPYTYNWRCIATGSHLGNESSCKAVQSGIFRIDVKDANGCSASGMKAVYAEGSISMCIKSITDETGFDKNDGSAVVSSGSGTLSSAMLYDLESDEYTNVSVDGNSIRLDGLHPGHYCVMGFTADGASAMAQFAIGRYVKMDVTKKDVRHVTAPGRQDGRIVLNFEGGIPPYTINGIRHETGYLELNGLKEGEFTFAISDSTLNTMSVNASVLSPEPLEVEASKVDDASCNAYSDGSVTLTAKGGWGDYQFAERDGEFRNNAYFGGLNAGKKKFCVIDKYGVTDSIEINIGEPQQLTASVAATDSVSCHGLDDGAVHFRVTGGTAPYRVTYDKESLDGTVVTNLAAGTYPMTFADSHKCTSADTLTVRISEPDELTIFGCNVADTKCGLDNGAISIQVSGGSMPYKYEWSENGDFFSNSKAICSLKQNGLYNVTVSDSHDCRTEKHFRVEGSRRTTIENIRTRDVTCYGYSDGIARIDSSDIKSGYPSASYWLTWPHGETGVMDVGVLSKGRYSVRLTDSNDCLDSASFVIDEPAAVTVNIGDDIVICPGNSHELDAGVHHAYDWKLDGQPLSSGRYLTADEAGEYSVEVRDEKGCLARDTMMLGIGDDALEAFFLISTEAALGDTVALIELSNMKIDSLKWQYDHQKLTDVTPGMEKEYLLLMPQAVGTQYITMWAYANGCVASETKELDVYEHLEQEETYNIGYNPLIVSALVTPNPSDGHFDLIVKLREMADIDVTITHVSLSRLAEHVTASNSDSYTLHFEINGFGNGIYILSLTCRNERRVAKLLIK